VTTHKMTEPNPISEGIIQELLTTMKGLQAKMAELKSGATGGSNLPTDKSGHATLPEGSDVRGNPQKRQLPGEEAGLADNENHLTDEEEGGTTFSLSEEGDAFIEAAFKSRLDKGLPNSKWLKSPEPNSFIASTIPKDVTRADSTAERIKRYWLDAAAPLAAIIEKTDAGEINQDEAIQGIRAALVQHHTIQRRKAILQQLNPQLKGLVKDEDFTTTAPFLFGPDFGEITKRRLEAAALIQKTQLRIFRSATPRNRATGVVGVAARKTAAPEGVTIKLGAQKELEINDYIVDTHVHNFLTGQMLKASRGKPEKCKLRYIGVKAACV